MTITQNKEKDMLKSSSCPTCKGSGYIERNITTEETQKVYGDNYEVCYAVPCPACNGGQQKLANEVIQRSKIPSLYYDKRYEDFNWNIYKDSNGKSIDTRKHKSYVDDFILNFSEWKTRNLGLYIYSQMRGTGKTLLASCICKELMQRYATRTKFISVATLIDEAKKPISDVDIPFMDIVKKSEVLVLDDMGATSDNKWLNNLLFEILDYRYVNGLVTLITSNKEQGNVSTDDRIVDRVYSITQAIPLPNCPLRQIEAVSKKADFLRERGLLSK